MKQVGAFDFKGRLLNQKIRIKWKSANASIGATRKEIAENAGKIKSSQLEHFLQTHSTELDEELYLEIIKARQMPAWFFYFRALLK